MIEGKCKMTKVLKDEVLFENNGTIFVSMLPLMIYEYIPGNAIPVIDGELWHKEDYERVKRLQQYVGNEFDSYEDMMNVCE